MTTTLEINDTGLLALTAPGAEPKELGPGLVLMEGKHASYGVAAASRSRLKPKLVYNRHWHQLDREPLGKPFKGLTRADLACGQLTEIRRTLTDSHPLVMIVPGTMNTNLPLLLGVAGGAGMSVNSAVDSAVAAARFAFDPRGMNLAGTSRALVLDLHLHQVTATEIQLHRGENPGGAATIAHGGLPLKPPPPKPSRLERIRVSVDEDAGWQTISDRLARYLAARFVRETRFDPLHGATSEQALYAALPVWLAHLANHDKHDIRLAGGGRTYSLTISRAELMDHLAEIYGRISALAAVAASDDYLLMTTHRLNYLPGLHGVLGENVHLPQGAALQGAMTAESDGELDGQGIAHFTALNVDARFEDPEPPPPAPLIQAVGPAPTHYMTNGIAHPIPADGLTLDPRNPLPGLDFSRSSARDCIADLNWRGDILVFEKGQHISLRNHTPDLPMALKAGDCLQLGPDMQVSLIRVED